MVSAAVPRRGVRRRGRRRERHGTRRRALQPTSPRCSRCRSSTLGARRRSTTSPRAARRKRCSATRTRIVRALEDVENALVALAGRAATARNCCRARRRRPTRRWATRNRCTTAARSTSCRCSMRSARGSSVRVGANDSNTQLLLDSVQLYKALGGGWQVFEPVGRTRCRRSAFAKLMKRRPTRGTVVKTSLAVDPSRRPDRRDPLGLLAPAAARAAAGRSHRRAPLRQDAGNGPLLRLRAGALRGRPGVPRRRQGREPQGRRGPEGARRRRHRGARRHRLQARRGGRATTAGRRGSAGAAGRVGSASG